MMGMPDYVPELLMSLSERFGLILAAAFAIMTLAPMDKLGLNRRAAPTGKLVQVVLFGMFGVLGTYTGNHVFQSYANLRAMGVITAGLLGGPVVGFGAGLVAGGHRLLIDIGGFSAIPCALSTLLEGTAAGIVSQTIKGNSLNWRVALTLGLVGESVHMLLVLAMSRPFADALALVQLIAVPMIVVNSLGAALFVEALYLQIRMRDKRDSGQVQQILSIANQSLAHLRSGLSIASAQATARIIFERVPVAAVAITSSTEVLAHIGAGSDHHVPGKPFRTGATHRVLATGQPIFSTGREVIGCDKPDCPLASAAVIPLKKSGEIVGALKLYGTEDAPLDQMRFELAKGLADLFSTQLELEDIQVKNQLLAHAEIRRLQAQINPHFLFNSLNTIASFCRTAPQQARDLLLDLALYMRQNLDSSRGLIPLADELDQVRSYLAIERARFGERIRSEIDLEPGTENWLIPPLIIQPLVENSVKHGIQGREQGGVVRLELARENGHLRVAVCDDGVGMDEAVVERLLADGGVESPKEGIGVRNCNLRLLQLFGPDYRMSIDSRPGSGTRVEFRIPKAGHLH
ncbi:MAG: histidine kinase [Desulfovibrionaceae bacterium]|jgi:two-component system sensor histidine kinase LytS|nr:histidine kinase [Desulfovibrionaceae bacterium]